MLIIDSFSFVVFAIDCVVCRNDCESAFYSFLVTCILAWYELMDLRSNCECVIHPEVTLSHLCR